MFGLGWTEILVIATIAILVVPPKDLPGLMRNVGRGVGKARRVMRDFQREIEDAARVDELPEIRRQVEQISRQTNNDFMRDLQNAPQAMRRSATSQPDEKAPPVSDAPAMTPLPAAEEAPAAPARTAEAAPAEAEEVRPAAPTAEVTPAAAKP